MSRFGWHSVRNGRILSLMLAFTIFAAGFAAGNLHLITRAQGDVVDAEAEAAFAPLWQAYNLVQSDYIDPADDEALVNGAIQGMIEALDDPFSGYMDPTTYDLMSADLEGEIEGVGIVLHTDEETEIITVAGVIDGSPAQKGGILPGDIFYAVDGDPIADMDQTELATRVRGAEGTEVTLTMLRDEEQLDFTLIRALIIIPNIETEVYDGGIAYVRLNQFSSSARTDLNRAFAEVDVNNQNGLIFDLRDNPGGYLDQSISVASAFIQQGVVVTESFGDDQEDIVYNANGDFAGITVPIVVLVNEASASASELVAGAMQDTNVATIMGETTFGKGTVQTWRQLNNGGGLRLTIARWLTPNGRWIHENGITPDIIVEWQPTGEADEVDLQLERALEFLREGAQEEDMPMLEVAA